MDTPLAWLAGHSVRSAAALAAAGRRLTDAVAARCSRPEGDPVRLSFGAAELGPGDGGDDLVDAADRAPRERKTRSRLGATPLAGAPAD